MGGALRCLDRHHDAFTLQLLALQGLAHKTCTVRHLTSHLLPSLPCHAQACFKSQLDAISDHPAWMAEPCQGMFVAVISVPTAAPTLPAATAAPTPTLPGEHQPASCAVCVCSWAMALLRAGQLIPCPGILIRQGIGCPIPHAVAAADNPGATFTIPTGRPRQALPSPTAFGFRTPMA